MGQIAPTTLIGRERELDELAAFCTSPTTSGRYLWWRAEAWSGKTALLSSFVLNPPSDVRVVSFFITRRLSGQNDQIAFLDNVLAQLFTLLRADVPELLTETTKHTHLLRLLDAATADCRSRGESFVLVVDGLDEDTGAGDHSIASLLPLRLPEGMRVVVAGRPNPPADAPDNHPLCSGAADIRSLAPSPAAVAMRRETERELKGLIHTNGLTKDLLGLICAAGGGLTAPDLADLTDATPYEVDNLLCTVAGRSFARRDNTYLLAHEELQATAVKMYGPRLAGYVERLQTWAARYDDQEWPESTPDYLLHGYASMLRSLPDPTRLVALVRGRKRQTRLRRRTGGDAAAYSQILAAQQVVSEHTPDDLLAMATLAAARGDLGAGNGRLPVELPAVWELLGHPERAAALAHGIVDRDRRSEALATLAEAVAESGDFQRAQDTADTITQARWRARAFTNLSIIANSKARQHVALLLDRAAATVNEIHDATDQARALVHLADGLRLLGRQEQVSAMLDAAEREDEVVGRSPGNLMLLTVELVACAEAVGDTRRTLRIINAIPDGLDQVTLFSAAAAKALGLGRSARGTVLLDRAKDLAAQLEDRDHRIMAWAAICSSAVHLDGHSAALAELAYAEADRDNEPPVDRSMLAQLVECSTACGDLAKAENTARMIPDSGETSEALAKVTRLALALGDEERAAALIAEFANSTMYEDPWGELALLLVRLGKNEHAITLAERAEMISRRHTTTHFDTVVADLVSAFCPLGWYDEAEAAASTIESPKVRARALIHVLSSLGSTKDRVQQSRLIDTISAILKALPFDYSADELLLSLVKALATSNEFTRAMAVVDSIPNRSAQAVAMATAAVEVAPANPEMAVVFAERALAAADSLKPRSHSRAYSDITAAFRIAGDADRAGKIMREDLPNQVDRDRTWHTVSNSAARSGDYELARRLLGSIVSQHHYELAVSDVVTAMARAGLVEEAQQLDPEIELGYLLDEATIALAASIVKTGDLTLAQQYADRLWSEERAPLLTELAIAAAEAEDLPVARHFLNQALTTSEQWSTSLKALGRIDPDALRQLAELIRTSRD